MSKRDAANIAKDAHHLGLLDIHQLNDALKFIHHNHPSTDELLSFLERQSYLTPWQSQKIHKGEKAGYFLGGYRLLYRIASGSFGRVFRADNPRDGTVVAIKVLRRRWSEQRRIIDLFEREGKVGLKLNHPNIVSVLAVNLDPATRQYYIVMEFVEGGNLRDFMGIRKKLEPGEALRLLEDTVSAQAYAYSLGVTHRDIKPTNILISSIGSAKLVDFGLADICNDVELDTKSKLYRTVDYAGLEKATGVKPGDVRSDIYFLGCVLYEMLTGRSALVLPSNQRARMHKERFYNAPPLAPGEVAAPVSVIRLVEKMRALNPQQRFQTPVQLLEAVRATRRDLNGEASVAAAKPIERSVFIVESNRHLQDTLRENFKKLGYRVFLAGDATAALNRFRQNPYDALVFDAGTAGQDDIRFFEQIIAEGERGHSPCVGILILSQDQAEWSKLIPHNPKVVSMVRPLTLGQVVKVLCEMVPPK